MCFKMHLGNTGLFVGRDIPPTSLVILLTHTEENLYDPSSYQPYKSCTMWSSCQSKKAFQHSKWPFSIHRRQNILEYNEAFEKIRKQLGIKLGKPISYGADGFAARSGKIHQRKRVLNRIRSRNTGCKMANVDMVVSAFSHRSLNLPPRYPDNTDRIPWNLFETPRCAAIGAESCST